jgi:ElaA protein
MVGPTVIWDRKRWSDLTAETLYEILALRQEVFVVEQKCPYADIDGRDQTAWLVVGHAADGRLIAYLRILEPGRGSEGPVMGRVIVRTGERGHGVGRSLMQEGLRYVATLFPGRPVRLSAQAYLQGFYESLGFVQIGGFHLEDGIPHVDMVKHPGNEGEEPRHAY